MLVYSPFNHLRRLLDREYFVKFRHCESFKLYAYRLPPQRYNQYASASKLIETSQIREMAKDAFEKHMHSIWPHISTHILFGWLKVTNDHVHRFSHTETSNSSFARLRLMPLVTLSLFQNIQPAFQLQWQHKTATITTTTTTTYPLPPAVENRQYVTSLILVDRCHVSKNAMHNQNDSLPHSQNSTDFKPELTLILMNHLSNMLRDCRWQVCCVTTRPAFPHVTPSWTLRLSFTTVSHSATWLHLGGAVSDRPNTLEYLGRFKNINNTTQIWLWSKKYLFYKGIFMVAPCMLITLNPLFVQLMHTKIILKFVEILQISENNHNCSNMFQFIQGVTGGTDQTSEECSLGHTIPI